MNASKITQLCLSWISLFFVLTALLAGFYWRVTDLGTWPLAVDEFYIARSVEFLLTRGLPEFPYGGYYFRGLAYQYLAAPFIAAGASPEIVLRGLSVVSGLLVLPAAFWIVRDSAGRKAAWIIVIILSLSTWQIEMARFGRMYAPFQAVFAWYLYHLYFLVIRQETGRWKWLVGLSLLGPLVWEGGIFLAVLNFIPFCLRFFRPYWALLPACFVVLGITLWYTQLDFRFMSGEPALPDGMTNSGGGRSLIGLFPAAEYLWFALNSRAGFLFLISCAAALGYCSWKLVNEGDLQWFSRVGLVILSLFTLTHQVMFACVTLVFLIAAGWVRLDEWRNGWVRIALMVNSVVILGWILVSTVVWKNDLMRTVKNMLAVPNFANAVVRPLSEVLPDIGAVLAGLIFIGILLLFFKRKFDRPLSLTITLCVVCLTLVAIVPTVLRETRYLFFAYPLLLITGLTVVARVISKKNGINVNLYNLVLLIPFLFLFSSDFHFSHLRAIGSYEANFRVGYPSALASHYYQRYDHRAPAEFVDIRAKEKDLIISTITPVSAYISRLDAIYLNQEDPRYKRQVYFQGKFERWSNAPLLSTKDEVREFLESHRDRAWLVVGKKSRKWNEWEEALIELPGLQLEFTSKDDAFEVYSWTKHNRSGCR